MKTVFVLVTALLAGCASTSRVPQSGASLTSTEIESMVTSRAPAQAPNEDQVFHAYRTMILESTKTRIQALEDRNVDLICNAIQSPHGTDTQTNYIAFESLASPEGSIYQKLNKEIGPFALRNYVSMNSRGLMRDLHFACIDGSGPGRAKIGANKAKIFGAMDAIKSVLSEE